MYIESVLLRESFRADGRVRVSIRSKPQVRLFGQFDVRRCAAGSSFIGDDLLQVFDAVTCEGGHAILADAIDPKAAILREHVARKVEEPVFVLAEQT